MTKGQEQSIKINPTLQLSSPQAPFFRPHAKIIHRQKHHADTEKHLGKRPETVVEKELSYHPNRIAAYPAADGQIMKQVCGVFSPQPGDVKSRRNCRHDHENAFKPPFQQPTPFFKKPQQILKNLILAKFCLTHPIALFSPIFRSLHGFKPIVF